MLLSFAVLGMFSLLASSLLFSFSVVIISLLVFFFFFFQAEDGIRDWSVTGVQTCALPISIGRARPLEGTARLRSPQDPRRPVGKVPPRRQYRRAPTLCRYCRVLLQGLEIGRASCRESVDLGGGRMIIKKRVKVRGDVRRTV